MSDTGQRNVLGDELQVCGTDPMTGFFRDDAPLYDLILDEPDDFGIEDLPALTRLVHWAGLLGSRVLLSSATLPPALVQGLFLAYLAGREEYQRNRGRPGEALAVCCAWFDEFAVHAAERDGGDGYLTSHQQFVDQRLARLARLATSEVRRRALIKPLPITSPQPREVVCREVARHVNRLSLIHI